MTTVDEARIARGLEPLGGDVGRQPLAQMSELFRPPAPPLSMMTGPQRVEFGKRWLASWPKRKVY